MIFPMGKDSRVLASPALLCHIFSYLNSDDLCVAAAVNSLWKEAANREYVQRKAVRACLFVPEQLQQCASICTVKHHATILFHDKKDDDEEAGVKNPLYIIERQHVENKNILIKLPFHLVMKGTMQVNTYLMEAVRGIIGLQLPLDQSVVQFYSKNEIKEFLGPREKKATFLLFGQFDADFLNEVKLRCGKKVGQSTLWGGYLFDPMCIDRKTVEQIGIKLTNVDSWSAALNYKSDKTKFDQKLLCLREKIKLKKHTIGLICGKVLFKKPSKKTYTSVQEIMQKIKEIFPEVLVIGGFSRNASTYYYGVDSVTTGAVRTIENTNLISFIILSHN